jgi:hypothetical protein
MRKAKGDHQKKLRNLTKAETALLRSRILKDEMGVEAKDASKERAEAANLVLEQRVHRRCGFTQKGMREWKEAKKLMKGEKQATKRERRGWAPKAAKK